jgi:predicted porin
MMSKLLTMAALAVLTHLTPAAAQEKNNDYPMFTINGYGTLGIVHSDEDEADFVSNLFAPEGAGYTREWSPEVDSRLGLQLTAQLNQQLTGILQLVTEQRYDNTYKPVVEWANLKYDLTPNLSVRVGRMKQSLFLTSEYRKVGYALPWVRPPEEVYRMIPVTNFDGIDFSYRTHFGDFTNTLRGTYGSKDSRAMDGSDVEARESFSLTNTLEWGATTLSIGYGQYRLTIEGLNPFFDVYRQFGSEGEAIADRYDVDDKRFEIMVLGGRYDPGDWFIMGELAYSNSETFIGDSRGWYVSGGYRFGAVTPYLTLARVWVEQSTSDPGLSTNGLPPPVAAAVGGLNTGLNGILGSVAQQKSITLGARWDIADNMALKAQYERLFLDDGSPGILVNIQPGFEPGEQVNLFSVSFDFVF